VGEFLLRDGLECPFVGVIERLFSGKTIHGLIWIEVRHITYVVVEEVVCRNSFQNNI
jgi:hypothetical protein